MNIHSLASRKIKHEIEKVQAAMQARNFLRKKLGTRNKPYLTAIRSVNNIRCCKRQKASKEKDFMPGPSP